MTEFILSLDLSHRKGSLALGSLIPEGPILFRPLPENGNHLENTIGELDQFLSETGVRLSHIKAFLTTSGPGSFTGLRLALSVLKAFAQVREVPLFTLGATQTRAASWMVENPNATNIQVVTQIATGRFAIQRFENRQTLPAALGEEISIDSLALNQITDWVLLDRPLKELQLEKSVVYPLDARQLVRGFYKGLSSLKKYSGLDEIIALSPNYFGGKFSASTRRVSNPVSAN